MYRVEIAKDLVKYGTYSSLTAYLKTLGWSRVKIRNRIQEV